jgi:predicted CXXCH cytochrome family protein
MHNSQDGAPVALTDAAWEAGGVLNGTTDSSPNAQLLVADCIGCHSSATSQTVISAGSSDIPIVYNHVEPASPLAGGNFYWAAEGDDTAGHNVYGISSQDANITAAEGAPGHNGLSCGYAASCHATLAAAPSPGGQGGAGNWNRGGCRGCHVFTYHHEDNGVYRFLKGHGGGFLPEDIDADGRDDISTYTDYVDGVEDDDWEQTVSSTDHNWYSGTSAEYYNDGFSDGLLVRQTITAFCSGCHWGFHGPMGVDVTDPHLGMGSAPGPWFRHPVDIALPTTGEFAAYDPTADYSAETPVGWETLPTDSSGAGAAGPIVVCVSCHRTHGSDQPDLLRFDYDTMLAGMGGSGGCFNCHSNKN